MTNTNTPTSPASIYAEEAKQLRALWDANAEGRPGQAQFGELFDIGGQSAVANFLNGRSPLSLKAALGFARGLQVRIQDFSPRLANEAIAIARSLEELKEYTPGKRSLWMGMYADLRTTPMLGEIRGTDDGSSQTAFQPQQNLEIEFWSAYEDPYALRIRGDAFYPRYRSGEFLILSDKVPPLEGYEALVSTWEGKKHLRIWNRVLDGEVQLLPLSPGQAPMTLKQEDIERVERVLGCAPRDALRQAAR